MKKGILISMTMLVSASLFFMSCGEEEELDLHTPEYNMISSVGNHALIFSYDFMKLMDKSDVKNSEDMPMEMKFAMNMYIGNMLNSSNMGIRLEGNNHSVAIVDDNGEFDFGFLTAEVVNEDKIKNGVKDFFKGKFSEEGGFKYLEHKFSPTIAVWDSTHIIFLFSEKDGVDLKVKAKSILDARKIEGADNQVLDDYLNREDDMNVLVYLDRWVKLVQKEAKEIELDEEFLSLYDDSYMIGSGNFLPGKIVFEMEMHADKLKDSKYNVLPGEPISKEFLSYLSPKDPMMFGVASVNMDALFDIMLQNEEMKSEFHGGIKEIGWTEKEMRKLFTGEMSAALVRIDMKPNPYYELQASLIEDDFFADMEESYVPNPSEIPTPVYVVTIGLNDSEKLKNLFLTLPVEDKGGYFAAGNDGFIVFNNDKLMITSDEEIAATLGSGKSLKEYKPTNDITSSLYGEVIPDIADLPQGLKDLIIENGGNEGEGLIKFMNEFENVTFSGSFDLMKLEVTMRDKEANSMEVISSKLMKQIIQNMSLFM